MPSNAIFVWKSEVKANLLADGSSWVDRERVPSRGFGFETHCMAAHNIPSLLS